MNMRSTHAPSIAAFILLSALAFPHAARAATTVQLNDPFTDALQLWSEVVASINSFANQLTAALGQQPALAPASHHPRASVAVLPPSHPRSQTAAAATPFADSNAATSSSGVQLATSHDATLSPFVKSAAFSTPGAPAASETSAALSTSGTSPVSPTESSPAPDPNLVTKSDLQGLLTAFGNAVSLLPSLISQPTSASIPQSVAADGNNADPYAAASAIDNLSNVTISNANLTASEIPTDIVASNYLPLSGGALTGPLTVPTLNASSTIFGGFSATNATSTNFFATNASTTNATSTNLFASLGTFTSEIANTLNASVANIVGLTAINSTTTNATTTNLYAASAVIPSLTGTAATFTGATSTNFFTTTASSTNLFAQSASFGSLAGNAFSSLTSGYLPKWNSGTWTNSLLYDNGTNVGVGTTSPFTTLAVNGTGFFGGKIIIGTSSLTLDPVLGITAPSVNTPTILSPSGSVLSNGTVPFIEPNIGPGATLNAYGDSITAGTGASTPASRYVNLVAAQEGWNLINNAAGGDGLFDQCKTQIWGSATGTTTISSFLIGQNDGGNPSSSSYASTYAGALGACYLWLLTPNKVFGNQLATTGTWSADTTFANGIYTTSNGATAATTTFGSVVYVVSRSLTANNPIFTVSVDGTAYGPYTLTTPFTANNGSTFAPYLVRIPNLADGHHSVVVTNSGTGELHIDFVTGNYPQLTPSGPMLYVSTIYKTHSLYESFVDATNAIIRQAAQQLASDGLGIVLANAEGDCANPGTVDAGGNPSNSFCSLYDGTHPNNAGHTIIANAFLRVMPKIGNSQSWKTSSGISSMYNAPFLPINIQENSSDGGSDLAGLSFGDDSRSTTKPIGALWWKGSNLGATFCLNTTNNFNFGADISALCGSPSGYVGINGQASPAYPLDVSGTGHFTGLVDAISFVATSSIATSTFAGGLTVDGSQFVVQQGSGNVGIGTNVPAAPLDVAGPTNISSFTGTSKLSTIFRNSSNGNYTGMDFITPTGGTGNPQVRIAATVSNGGSYLQFGTTNNFNLGITNTALTIDPSGNVGIGTTTPTAALTVSTGGNSPGGVLVTNQSGGSSATSRITFAVPYYDKGSSGYIDYNSLGHLFTINAGYGYYGSNSISLQTIVSGNPQTQLIVNGSNVGIGTTSPFAKLDVAGTNNSPAPLFQLSSVASFATTTEFIVNNNGNATLAGTLTQSSDQRLKTNIQSLNASSSLAAIDALNPVTFNWIDPNQGGTPQLGFIAQDVPEDLPDARLDHLADHAHARRNPRPQLHRSRLPYRIGNPSAFIRDQVDRKYRRRLHSKHHHDVVARTGGRRTKTLCRGRR